MQPIAEESSKRITVLRPILITLIILAHNNHTVAEALNNNFDSILSPDFWKFFLHFVTLLVIAPMSLKIFFLFSGFLTYKKNDSYPLLVKKRTRSLLLPLLLWTSLTLLLIIIGKILLNNFLPSKVDDASYIPFIHEWGFFDWIQAFFGYYSDDVHVILREGYITPLWFIRDLFILTLISPLLKACVEKLPFTTFFISAACLLCSVRPLIVAPHALFYYLAGFYWAKYDIDLFKIADKAKFYEIIPTALVLLYVYLFKKLDVSLILSLISFLILFKISKLIIQNEKANDFFVKISAYSFFIYAIHQPLLMSAITRLWNKLIPKNSITVAADFFLVSFATIFLSLLAGILLNKICPPLFALLNGGRTKISYRQKSNGEALA